MVEQTTPPAAPRVGVSVLLFIAILGAIAWVALTFDAENRGLGFQLGQRALGEARQVLGKHGDAGAEALVQGSEDVRAQVVYLQRSLKED